MTLLLPSAYDFQIALQEEKGIPASAPTHFLKCLDGSDIKADPEPVTIKTGEGKRMNDGISYIAGAPVAGSLIIVCQDDMLPLTTYLAGGTLETSGGADPYTHTGKVNQTGGVPYATVFKHVGPLYEIFPDCKVNTWRYETASDGENQILKLTLGVVGIGLPTKESAWAVPAVAEDSDHIFLWHKGAGAWVIDGDTVAGISQWILEGNNNLETVPGETKTGYDLAEGECDVTCISRLVVEDLARYYSYMYGSETPADGTPLNLDAIPVGSFAGKLTRVGAAPGPERSFAVSIPELTYAVGEPPAITGNTKGTPIYHSLAGRATGADPKISMVTKNGVASYDLPS